MSDHRRDQPDHSALSSFDEIDNQMSIDDDLKISDDLLGDSEGDALDDDYGAVLAESEDFDLDTLLETAAEEQKAGEPVTGQPDSVDEPIEAAGAPEPDDVDVDAQDMEAPSVDEDVAAGSDLDNIFGDEDVGSLRAIDESPEPAVDPIVEPPPAAVETHEPDELDTSNAGGGHQNDDAQSGVEAERQAGDDVPSQGSKGDLPFSLGRLKRDPKTDQPTGASKPPKKNGGSGSSFGRRLAIVGVGGAVAVAAWSFLSGDTDDMIPNDLSGIDQELASVEQEAQSGWERTDAGEVLEAQRVLDEISERRDVDGVEDEVDPSDGPVLDGFSALPEDERVNDEVAEAQVQNSTDATQSVAGTAAEGQPDAIAAPETVEDIIGEPVPAGRSPRRTYAQNLSDSIAAERTEQSLAAAKARAARAEREAANLRRQLRNQATVIQSQEAAARSLEAELAAERQARVQRPNVDWEYVSVASGCTFCRPMAVGRLDGRRVTVGTGDSLAGYTVRIAGNRIELVNAGASHSYVVR